MSVGASLSPHTEDIPRIAMAPPHSDSSDGASLSVSLTSAVAVDYVTVFFVFRCRMGRLDGPGGYVWLGNDSRSTGGCN